MQYKTMVLELLKEMPEIHDRLRENRTLLATLERLAAGLKDSHEAWKVQLARSSPNSSETQLASAALEMALADLEAALLPASLQAGNDPPSLDGAMAYLRRHSPPA